MGVRFNLNDEVRVKPNEKGLQMIAAYYGGLQLDIPDYAKPRWDGTIKLPMWKVMNIFGDAMYMGPEPPIEMEVEFA